MIGKASSQNGAPDHMGQETIPAPRASNLESKWKGFKAEYASQRNVASEDSRLVGRFA